MTEHEGAAGAVFFEEFALLGGVHRADLVSLNGISHGYEIKSDRDSLVRLPAQVKAYSAIFERVTLISAKRHLSSARTIIPKWWGIVRVDYSSESSLCLERIRRSKPNPRLDSQAVAMLLWRPEALNLLTQLGLDSGVRSKPMQYLTEKLALNVDPAVLSNFVREIIRSRGDWRFAARLKRCDGTSRRLSNPWGFRRNLYGSKNR
jgi:hypothetical protein